MRSEPLVVLVLALVTSACGGQVDPKAQAADTGGVLEVGSDAADAAAEAEGGSSTDAAPPPESVCDELATAICSKATSACCTSHAASYDETACRDAELTYCSTERDWVLLGRLTYDASQLAACKAAWTKAVSSCSLGWIEWAKVYAPCAQLFNGVKASGDTCKYDIECHSPPLGRAYCDTSLKKCRTYDFVGVGKGCNFTGKDIHYCDEGLYCDTTSTTPTCTKEHALGAACDGASDISCGYGKVCKDLKCAVGLPPGSPCDEAVLECASWTCTGGKCAPNDVVLADPEAGLCSPAASDAGATD